MQQPTKLLMCSKFSKHINVPSSRDGDAQMVLCFTELMPKACRGCHEKSSFCQHNVTTLTPINQEKRQRQRRAQRHSGVLDTLVTCALWPCHPHFGFPNQGSELSWKTGSNWMFFKYAFIFTEQHESQSRFSVSHKHLLRRLQIKHEIVQTPKPIP